MLRISRTAFAEELEARLFALAKFSEDSQVLVRQYLSAEHRAANAQVATWMQAAGMTTRVDAVGNLIGRLEGTHVGPALVFGSHIDTVRDAGLYDGALGIVLPILCIEHLHRAGWRPSRPVEVVAFGDEEGVRFQSTYLGSRAMAGRLDAALLDAVDVNGMSMRLAMDTFGLDAEQVATATRDRNDIGAYVEVHIEQGPVLEAEDLAVGIVTAIAGATRRRVTIRGMAGHAGTVPMRLRQDALAASAEVILNIETRCQAEGLVGTVGQLDVAPGAVNVIPGAVSFSLDVRSETDEIRTAALRDIDALIDEICGRRGVDYTVETTHDAGSVACDPDLSERLAASVVACNVPPRYLPSGAGHDAAAMAELVPSAMLFVRCKAGISHHPDEYMSPDDGAAAGEVVAHFLQASQK